MRGRIVEFRERGVSSAGAPAPIWGAVLQRVWKEHEV